MLATNQSQSSLAQLTARKLQIIEVEAWFQFLQDLAKNRGLHLELENRYWKSAYIYSQDTGDKLGRIWINGLGIICYDRKNWVSHFEQVPTLESAINELVDSAIEF